LFAVGQIIDYLLKFSGGDIKTAFATDKFFGKGIEAFGTRRTFIGS